MGGSLLVHLATSAEKQNCKHKKKIIIIYIIISAWHEFKNKTKQTVALKQDTQLKKKWGGGGEWNWECNVFIVHFSQTRIKIREYSKHGFATISDILGQKNKGCKNSFELDWQTGCRNQFKSLKANNHKSPFIFQKFEGNGIKQDTTRKEKRKRVEYYPRGA